MFTPQSGILFLNWGVIFSNWGVPFRFAPLPEGKYHSSTNYR
jgi:hypothetical protein